MYAIRSYYEGNFDEPELAEIHEKGTFTYKYNGNAITYQEIINMLKAAALGSTLTFDYDSALNNQSSNYTGHYYGKMNFTVTSMLFNGVDEGLSVNLSNT